MSRRSCRWGKVMFCTACGAAASQGDRFCRRCGRGLLADSPAPPAPAVVPRILTAAPQPDRPRRNFVRTGLRVVSLLGMAPSLVGAWMLLQEPAASGSPPASVVTEPASSAAPEPTGRATASQEPAAEPATLSCTSPYLGYGVTYPAELVTLDAPARHACRYFHTEPFEAPRGGDLPATQIRIYPSSNTYRYFDRLFDPETNADLVSRLNLEVGGYPAIKVEFETEEGDSALYAYVIDVAGQTLVLDTYEGYDPDFRSAKSNLDAIVSGLDLSSGGVS